MNQDKNNQKKYLEKKIVQQLSEQDLQAATGGCRGCAAVVRMANKESNELINTYERRLAETHSVDAALPLSNKAAQFRELARTVQAHVTTSHNPCAHCQDHLKELQRLKK